MYATPVAIADLAVDYFRIPLPEVLSDATHREIASFELVTVRCRTTDGVEGVGYTYTVGVGAGAADRASSDRPWQAKRAGTRLATASAAGMARRIRTAPIILPVRRAGDRLAPIRGGG